MERQDILELDGLLSKLLQLKDSDFIKFINSDTVKPFLSRLQMFWSMASVIEVDEVSFGLHEKILKFLLRLCPSFNKFVLKNREEATNNLVLKSVICPKKFVESLFDSDPLGLLTYLYSTWSPSEYLDIIRDDLIPDSLIKTLSKKQSGLASNEKFLKWITKNSTQQGSGPMRSTEKESILRRFEYESDDDYFEEDNEGDTSDNTRRNSPDPLQVILLSNYIKCPSAFSRTAPARKSPERLLILKQANLSHEQLEGWALMLERNPKKSNIIQDFIIWQKTA